MGGMNDVKSPIQSYMRSAVNLGWAFPAGLGAKCGAPERPGGTQTEQARELWTFNKVNFARIAEDMGALGIRVEHPSGIETALAQALAANRPAVIDVVTDIDALAPTAVI
jgi:acetolactate synthase-1/2/3 large subunit